MINKNSSHCFKVIFLFLICKTAIGNFCACPNPMVSWIKIENGIANK